MPRNLTTLTKHGPLNSLQYWPKLVPWWRVVWNFICIYLAKYSPSLGLKVFLYRLTGAKIGKHVSIGLAVVFDVFYPQLITIEDNAVVGYNTVILCHEFLVRDARIGPVVIGRDVMIGANSTVLAGVTIGAGTEVSAMSLVNTHLPPGVLAGGVPVKVLRARAEG
ncbi:MAG: acetyltransferase [Symbiobacteriaceae bacterium]|jgi:acetyltransferase-like isoleucine patch superfamily enzyme|nr:acetyltransferase [Symbiobacteriaceae bacterium]